MAPYGLNPNYMRFYAIGGRDDPIELVLDYYDPDQEVVGMARTYWHPAAELWTGRGSPQLDTRAEALEVMTKHLGHREVAEAQMRELELKVKVQLALIP